MSSKTIIGIVVVLVALLGTIVLIHQHQADQLNDTAAVDLQSLGEQSAHESNIELDQSLLPGNPSPLPRLVDLGADNCLPCKMMAPILQELKVEYAHLFATHFIDVWKNPAAGRQFSVRMIPTQIFYDAEGKELFRHEGFMSKQDILRQWRRLGIEVEATG
ncbi:Thioredoxin [Desulfonatronum thiosulfatophilum]|uniref:Thioredoxin n=1 Tax=Desulfonatronum thiosulfatophilum TaxID=617002 RepID=A0A1G6E9C8_9BACT|nr:thioredoxin family protein [Desulfonatronum thiosulfatophilum]SDB53555.1 Thioredoxin [Desulfonatronum thiosulfatophilum]